MSGWDGWPLPKQCTFSVAKNSSSYWLGYMGAPASVKTNSWGIRIVSNPTGDPISLIYISLSNTAVKTIALNEGVVNIIPPMTEDFANLAFSLPNHPVGSVVEFEQIPLYGGALVSDGVDDYAVSDEVIDEEIGGVVLHCTDLREADDAAGYAFGNSWQLNSIFGYFSTSSAGVNGMTYGDTKGNDGEVTTARTEGKDLLFGFSREPSFHGYPLYISRLSDASSEYGKIAFYQLRLIKSQPTETQLEVIKQQVLREHNDYLKEMG